MLKAFTQTTLCKLGIICLVFALLTSCSVGDSTANLRIDDRDLTGALQITGSSTASPLMRAIANEFTVLHPHVKINIASGGSAMGISDVREKKSDIGMVSRLIAEDEKVFKGFPIARDGVGLMVNKANPVKNLTYAQIRGIFSGKITNWRQVGGRNAAIIIIGRASGRGVTEVFMTYFKLTASEIPANATIGENSAVAEMVGALPNTITFFSVITAESHAKAGLQVKLLLIDGLRASRANILTGDYPLTRPLTLVTREQPTGLTKIFIEFCLSPQVNDIIENLGFVPYQE